MRMKIFFSLKVAMGHYWLLKTLSFFFFLKIEVPQEPKPKYFIWSWAKQSQKLYFGNSVKNACSHGAYKSYSFVSGHAMVSVLWPFPDVSLPFLDGKLQGLQERTLQPGLWTPLWIWGAQTTVHMGTTVDWGGLFVFLNSEIFHFEMPEYVECYSFQPKSTSFYCF